MNLLTYCKTVGLFKFYNHDLNKSLCKKQFFKNSHNSVFVKKFETINMFLVMAVSKKFANCL